MIAAFLTFFAAITVHVIPAIGQQNAPVEKKQAVEADTQLAQMPAEVAEAASETPTPAESGEVVEPATPKGPWYAEIWHWLQLNGAALIVVFGAFLTIGETIAHLTPTQRDDAWFRWLRGWFDKRPNFKKGGGTHPPKV